jgi:hypothetical protein
MAYDAARGQVVLFGGTNGVPDTWVWDGSSWVQKFPPNRPSTRSGHAMAYDAARGQVVLFGGSGSSGALNDTWVWDGYNWIQKFPAHSPPARSGHAMAYDAARGQVVLFGGGLDDTWVWAGTDWVQKFPANRPLGRYNHAMAFDAARGQVVLFGGGIYGGERNDTWVWDGTNWVQKFPANSPSARSGHAMAYDAARGQVVLFGGALPNNDTWLYPGCSIRLMPSELQVSSAGLSGSFSVSVTGTGCSWTARSSASWLQIVYGASGTGSGAVGFVVSPNATEQSRTATVTVGGQTLTVTQAGTAVSGTPFALTATPRCWEGDSTYPAGPGILLQWEDLGWPSRYEIVRDGQVIGTARGNQFYNIVGLTPGRTYQYQVRAWSSTASLSSVQAVATAPTGCPTAGGPALESLTLVNSMLTSGQTTTAKLRLTAAAPAGGVTVTLSSSNALLTVPASVAVAAGQNTATFPVTAGTVAAAVQVTVTARLGAGAASATVDLRPNESSNAGVAYLLLHGLNSDPETWKDLIYSRFGYCDRLKIVRGDSSEPFRAEYDGPIYNPWDPGNWFRKDWPSNGCYALEFNSSEAVLPGGGDWESGDGLTYEQLGMQVGAAVKWIVQDRKPATIVLVGHSRGGLAARAYLQALNAGTTFRKALVTIGTPHRGSPFGRIKWWMDAQGYKWTDTLATTEQIAAMNGSPLVAVGALVIRQELRFVFSPSTGYLGTAHTAGGTLDLVQNPPLKQLDDGASRLSGVVDATGQIVSTGLGLGENLLLGCNVFTAAGLCPPLAAILPGDLDSLRNYVMENITSGPAQGWSTNTDGVVPAASQQMPGSWFGSGVSLVTRYLDRIKHTDLPKQVSCIDEVLNTVVGGLPAGGMSTGAESEGKAEAAVGESRTGGDLSAQRLEAAEMRQRLSQLEARELVERAVEGAKGETLEGLLSRQEMRRRDAEGRRAVARELGRVLEGPDAGMRRVAVRLMAEAPVEESVEAVLGVLRREKDEKVREAAARSLVELARRVEEEGLRGYLSQGVVRLAAEAGPEEGDSFRAAVEALVELGGAAEVERLLELYEGSGEGRRWLIRERMGELRNGEGARRLAVELKGDPEVRQDRTRLAGEVLAAMSTVESVEGLLEWAMGVEQEEQRREAVKWLRAVRTPAARARLQEGVVEGQFRSAELQQELAEALANTNQCTQAPATPIN